MEKRTRKKQEVFEKINHAIETDNWKKINADLISKRLNWFKENKTGLELKGTDVKKAYTLLLLEYLQLNPSEVPIVFENDRKIVWRSFNWCPVLEACKKGGFDTRKICKNGWEQSVQLLIKEINSNLKFSRNYNAIRPNSPYCEEFIELID